MDITYVDNLANLAAAREEILKANVVGFDMETTGFDPHVDESILLQLSTKPDHAYVFNVRELNDPTDFEFFKDMLGSPQVVKIAQNAKFDLQFLTSFFNEGPLEVESLFDTMIASKLVNCEVTAAFKKDRIHWVNPVRHSLADIALLELHEVLDKDLQKSNFGAAELSQAQIEYAARDAAILLPIREKQIGHMKSMSLERVARLEFDAIAAIADTEYNGIYLDAEEWSARGDKQYEDMERLKVLLLEHFTPVVEQIDLFGVPDINLGSPVQILTHLKRLGVPLQTTGESELNQFKGKFPVVDQLLEYRENETALKKFGPEYLEFINPKTGRIHASFHQITAPSGRMSCSKPGLQQVPQDNEYRKCFKAQHGRRMITADYGQIELRIMALQSRDPELVGVFQRGDDLHTHTAMYVLHADPNNITSVVRRIAKNANFGTAYGVGDERFAVVAGIPVSEATKVLKNFWKLYSVLDNHLTAQGRIAENQGVARTHSGRLVKLRFDREDRRMCGSARRLGRNFGVQGTGADILKRALYLFRNANISQGLGALTVNIVHDELVVEGHDVDRVSEHDRGLLSTALYNTMMQAGQEVLEDIPCIVDIKGGTTWQK